MIFSFAIGSSVNMGALMPHSISNLLLHRLWHQMTSMAAAMILTASFFYNGSDWEHVVHILSDQLWFPIVNNKQE